MIKNKIILFRKLNVNELKTMLDTNKLGKEIIKHNIEREITYLLICNLLIFTAKYPTTTQYKLLKGVSHEKNFGLRPALLKNPKYMAIKDDDSCNSVNKKPRKSETAKVLLNCDIPNLELNIIRNKKMNNGYKPKILDDTFSIRKFKTKNVKEHKKKKEVDK